MLNLLLQSNAPLTLIHFVVVDALNIDTKKLKLGTDEYKHKKTYFFNKFIWKCIMLYLVPLRNNVNC